ncbi:MAG: bifunctional precorrin-2 dehydrogenase/sirohydrochlorin ferrochelatase [Actinobacteria bacterium]|nr:bifunctional precorrin-2 dehydrogenase/sirohydrochlorin ferrochelatase [Actinomycetota bacterium]
MAFGYPVVLDLTDVPVLMVGGGQIASRKVAGLLAAGARVTVVAPMVLPDLAMQVHEVRARPYEAADLDGHRLVMTATDDAAVNAAVGRDATAAGVWVNSADDPENCSFILPAVTRRGPVVVAVGTDGSSPALARHLRDRIASEILTAEVETAAVELARQRAEFHAQGISTETVDWSDRLRAALEPRGEDPELR